MRQALSISMIVVVSALSAACGRVDYEEQPSLIFDAGSRPDSSRGLLYDDAGRLINTDAAVPDGQVLVGTVASATFTGNAASGVGIDVDVSSGGEIVAFASRASNLAGSDNNGAADIFFYNTATQTVTRAALSAEEPNGATGELTTSTSNGKGVFDGETSAGPSLSNDGARVAFASTASNWVSGDTNNLADVFVYTRTPVSAIRASVSETGTQGTGASWAPALAGAADVVAFVSNADDLAAGDVSDFDDIFVRDFAANSTTRVTREDGTELNGNSRQPSISDDGNLVAFVTEATNVETAGTTSGLGKVVVWDRRDGTLSTVSVNNSGDAADRSSAFPRISGNGRYVVFISSATNLGPDSNGLLDVYRRDLQTGVTECASMGRDGFAATAFRSSADISGDGRFIVFGSISGALVDNDYNGVGDVFLRDMQMANTMVVSVTPNLRVANDLSRPRAIAPDGTAIAFISDATDVVAGDNNGFADVFVVNDLSW